MASIAPSILLAIAVTGVLVTILGGVVQYYSTIYSEPLLLPAYGTIYVYSVDEANDKVEIVNRFGYSVEALFFIAVKSAPSIPQDADIPRSFSFRWVIRPGVSEIDIRGEVVVRYGEGADADLSKSYFIIGNMKYPLVRGAGALKPSEQLFERSEVVSASGLGTKIFSEARGSSTIYFASNKMSIDFRSDNYLGYRRSVYNYRIVTKCTEYHEGLVCRTECKPEEGQVVVCNEYGCYCVDYTCYICDSYAVWKAYCESYETFECADEGGWYSYYWTNWTSTMSISTSFDFTAGSLLGFGDFTYSSLAKDTLHSSFPPTSFVCGMWPYILEDQSYCRYTYVEKKWDASVESETDYKCDSICGTAVNVKKCSNWISETKTKEEWACSSSKCAATSVFLCACMAGATLNTASLLTVGDKVYIRFDLTMGFSYTRYEDPELNDNYLRLLTTTKIRISLPKLRGYVSIPYTHELKDIKVKLVPSGSHTVTVESDDYKWKGSYYLDLRFGGRTALTTTYTPVGYVAIAPGSGVESAKTFAFETSEAPYLDISIGTTPEGMPVALLNRETGVILVRITVDVYITPVVEVSMSTVIPE